MPEQMRQNVFERKISASDSLTEYEFMSKRRTEVLLASLLNVGWLVISVLKQNTEIYCIYWTLMDQYRASGSQQGLLISNEWCNGLAQQMKTPYWKNWRYNTLMTECLLYCRNLTLKTAEESYIKYLITQLWWIIDASTII